MKKGVIAAVAALVVLGGLGAAAVPLIERHAADNIRRQIERDGLATVGKVEVGLFDRSLAVHDLQAKGPNPVSVEFASLSGLAWPLDELLRGNAPLAGWKPGDPVHARRLEVRNQRFSGPNGQSGALGSLVAEGIELARQDTNIPPAPMPICCWGHDSWVPSPCAGRS